MALPISYGFTHILDHFLTKKPMETDVKNPRGLGSSLLITHSLLMMTRLGEWGFGNFLPKSPSKNHMAAGSAFRDSNIENTTNRIRRVGFSRAFVFKTQLEALWSAPIASLIWKLGENHVYHHEPKNEWCPCIHINTFTHLFWKYSNF